MSTTKPLEKEAALKRYGELMHIINIGAYSEAPPDDYEGEEDGSYWYQGLNVSRAIDQLDERAANEGLRFIGTKADGKTVYSLETMPEEEQAIYQVMQYAYDRFSELSIYSVQNFSKDEMERLSTDKNGYLDIFIKDVEIDDKEQEDDGTTIWYVRATLMFFTTDQAGPIEGSTDIYKAYRGTHEWIVEWHAS